jgi:uroporphyrinogen-III synthase
VKKEQLLVASVMEITSPETLPYFCSARLGTLDALLITSPHALRYVAQYGALKHLPAYVVGARAQVALRKFGHEGEIFIFDDSAACLDALKALKNKPLEEMGSTCERVITYRQAAAQTLPDALIAAIRDHTISHVTLTSPRIALLCSTLAQRYGGLVGEITALCQSKQIAKVGTGVGFERKYVASEPTADAMVELVKKVAMTNEAT